MSLEADFSTVEHWDDYSLVDAWIAACERKDPSKPCSDPWPADTEIITMCRFKPQNFRVIFYIAMIHVSVTPKIINISVYNVWDNVLSTSNVCIHSFHDHIHIMIVLGGKYYYRPHFTHEETKTEKLSNCQRSLNYKD